MNRGKYRSLLYLLTALCFAVKPSFAQTVNLYGQWQVRLGNEQQSPHIVRLPGTLDDAGIGNPLTDTPRLTIASLAHLARKTNYVGKAYYTRQVTIPSDWKGKHIILSLGRVLWRSQVRIDSQWIDENGESLVTEHQFDLSGKLIPGKKHTITILVDNSNIYPGINIYERKYPNPDSYEMTHAYTNHTQVKWNGILGHIMLQARSPLYIKQTVVQPLVNEKKLKVRYTLQGGVNPTGRITSFVTDPAGNHRWKQSITTAVTGSLIEAEIAFDQKVKFWNEFNPDQYQLMSVLQTNQGNDTVITTFGIRDLSVKERNLNLNGERLFIRGNLECIIFPLAGYPPTDRATWRDLYLKAKSYGLNSFRFHSWCPPKAAFEAADEVGFYLQVELPHWNLQVGKDTATFAFLRREAHRILEQYGNHPSFLFFSMGNELEGNFKLLNNLVQELKAEDSRHLYATTSFTFQKDITGAPQPSDDFFVTQWTKDGWVRGQGVFNDQSPDFSKDYSTTSANVPVPLISHEIGQYSVYPDLSEIPSYTGNLVPNNFIAIRNDLEKKGRLSLAPDFLRASGKLATLLYKEEIERALKTKTFDGFQLLQLQDFPGQGTALVGVLNAFWQSKGFVTAEQFRHFNNALTPLIRFPKAIYTSNEHFIASVELANFLRPLQKASVYWKISTEKGKVLRTGTFRKADYPVGNGLEAGAINFPLNTVSSACRLEVEVGITGSSYQNSWSIWVYPAGIITAHDSIVITDSYTTAITALNKGQSVLLSPPVKTLMGVEGRFVPVFWSPVHFPDQPGTMGQLIKSQHPSLRSFPTSDHTDWQWWDLVKKSKALQVDSLPDNAIIVRVIDNFVSNGNLASLFEVKVGNGKLLFSGMDLLTDTSNRPAARQLYNSLVDYMKTEDFNPTVTVSAEWIRKFVNIK